jgi:hypothetical protein
VKNLEALAVICLEELTPWALIAWVAALILG